MDFLTNEKFFFNSANSEFNLQIKRVEKVKEIVKSIHIQDVISNEEQEISKYIEKQLNFIANKIISSFSEFTKSEFEDEEVIFKTTKLSVDEIFNGVIAVFGYFQNEEFKVKISKLPKLVASSKNIIIVIDVFNGVSLIPWENQ